MNCSLYHVLQGNERKKERKSPEVSVPFGYTLDEEGRLQKNMEQQKIKKRLLTIKYLFD